MVDPWSIGFVDPWSIGFIVLCLAICGPSPVAVPLAVWLVLGDTSAIWTLITTTFPGWQTPAIFIPSISIFVYWVNGLLLLFMDMLFRPEVLGNYKIQKSQSFDTKLIWKVVRNLITNQFFIIFPFSMGVTWLKRGDDSWITGPIPSHREHVLHFIGFILVNEIIFYYGHRMLHHKSLYGRCHKIHHEFTSPVALTAIYCHPFEMLVSNVIPLFGGVLPLDSHIHAITLWTIFAVLGTQTHHCGYDWPWMWFDHQPNFHDFHHEKFSCNFGGITWLDWFHGTDKQWQKHLVEEAAAKKAELTAKKEG